MHFQPWGTQISKLDRVPPSFRCLHALRERVPAYSSEVLVLLQDVLGEDQQAAVKKLSENEARVMELTDQWKDRWRETQKILEVRTSLQTTYTNKLLHAGGCWYEATYS